MKLAVGTAQFGLDYGVANTAGKLAEETVRGIIEAALDTGADLFDTAPAYGDSEQVLGNCLPPGAGRIVTKTPHFHGDRITEADLDATRLAFEQSLQQLRRDAVHGLMVHNPRDLTKPGIDELVEMMVAWRDEGLVEHIGASLYLPEQLETVLERFPFDLVQAPFSLLDQRLLQQGLLQRCAAKGVEFHARSIFLQGFLLTAFDELPAWFSPYREIHASFEAFCEQNELTPLQAALAFVAGRDTVDQMICGVASLEQFADLLNAMGTLHTRDLSGVDFASMACNDDLLVSPNRWKELRQRDD